MHSDCGHGAKVSYDDFRADATVPAGTVGKRQLETKKLQLAGHALCQRARVEKDNCMAKRLPYNTDL